MDKCYSYYGAPLDVRIKSRINIDPRTKCWLWIGTRDANGYARITVAKKFRLAHRISWSIFRGPIPAGLFVLHKCDTPPCVNPDHLFLGTQKDNAQDCLAKGRWPKLQRNAKLSWEDVNEIRRLKGQVRPRELAIRFGVGRPQIYRIHNNKRWAV